MKFSLFTFTFCVVNFIAKSQSASVEKSTSGIQIGVLGTWLYNEAKLSDKLSLRSEVGLDAGIFGIMHRYEVGYILIPDITIEPRYYYNLNKRVTKSKSIAGNSGNFFSLKTSYYPDWFVITKNKSLRPYNHISVIPTCGMKRTVGNHFTFETGIGFGYRYYFTKVAGFMENELDRTLNLHLRIGYRF